MEEKICYFILTPSSNEVLTLTAGI